MPRRAYAASAILIVDDDELVRSAMTRVLRRAGHIVDEAPSGEAALLAMRAGGQFDLVITDIELPDLDGASLAAAVRALPQHGDPSFLFTSRRRCDLVSELWSSCAGHVLLKPFHTEELLTSAYERLRIRTSR